MALKYKSLISNIL